MLPIGEHCLCPLHLSGQGLVHTRETHISGTQRHADGFLESCQASLPTAILTFEGGPAVFDAGGVNLPGCQLLFSAFLTVSSF